MRDRFYITTPIYYVNDRPHIGHAYTTIAADVLNRYHISLGRSTFFLTGTDEHGQKVEKAAKERGVEPQKHCDELSSRFRELWKILEIEPSAFIRTTDADHRAFVRKSLSDLHRRGLIERREFSGWYCTPCERYWTRKDLDEDKCPDCRRAVELLSEKAYFFLMSRYQDRIRTAIASGELKILPASRKNETLGFLEKGLEDLCISRPRRRLGWGIPLPFDEEYTTYVWFDALLNYVSGPEYLSKSGDAWWPADLHLIGKDILTTHAVYWPAMLMALELPLPRTIVAHGWWNFSGAKMSKSVGNVVDPVTLIKEYGGSDPRAAVDAFRYFLLAESAFGQDGNFSFESFERRWTADLSNDLGNLLSRVSSLVIKILDGRVESVPKPEDAALIAEYRALMEECQFQKALDAVWQRIRATNLLIQSEAPWSNRACAPDVLGRAVAVLGLAAGLLRPFMPRSAEMIAERLGMGATPDISGASEKFTASPQVGPPLFVRPEATRPEEVKVTEQQSPAETAETGMISIEEFGRVDLRVARVIAAKKVERADRLLELRVEIGGVERTLVAGIAKTYLPEDLIGKCVVVVANLKPAKLRGIVSHGMILAASSPDGTSGPVLVAPISDMPSGSTVK